MSEIAFPISTAPGINTTESGGRLINCFSELAPAGSRSKFVWRHIAGLRPVFTAGDLLPRGALKLGTTLVLVNDDNAYSISKSGDVYTVSAALTGTVGGSDRLIMARNMRSTPQIIAVAPDGTMTKIESGACSSFSDADLPVPTSVCFKDGFFFFSIADGRCFASGINDVTIASTDYARAESSPDSMVRVIPVPSGIAMMGESTIEIWGDTAEATGFPFSRSSVLPMGLYGKYAVAGFEEGFPGGIGFVANDSSVQLLAGYSTQRISTPDLERLIGEIEDHDTLEMGCYVASGRAVFTISSDDWTWEYCTSSDGATPPHWRERKSLLMDRWRARFTVNAFDEWLALDADSTSVFRIDPSFRREDTEQLVWELRSTQAHGFPGRAVVNRASFDFMTGVGVDTGVDPIETAPQVAISWSVDGGRTFSNPILRDLGAQGSVVPIDIWRLGMAGRLGIQYKLQIADPVEIAFFGGAMDVEARAA